MGIFSSSWKYNAYAATTSLFEEDNHPHTFQTVMLEGLRMDDSFANILAFSFRTDMYARTRSMVKYATREVDPYIRGLPTSEFGTFTVEKEWINDAILREIKMPLEDFYWLKHGDFDPDFLTNMFIHDHYMDINYFPWPDGCLLPLANPNFDDGSTGWILDNSVVNDRIGELTTAAGTLYNESVGVVSAGEIISLRAVCDRGTNLDNGQLGSLNLTFYDGVGGIITTEHHANTTGLNGAWELLTVIATAPAGTVTAKAWASGIIPVSPWSPPIFCFSHIYEQMGTYDGVLSLIDFTPYSEPGYDKFHAMYNFGSEPSYDWYVYQKFTDIILDGNGQILFRIDSVETVTGFQTNVNDRYYVHEIGVWADLYDIWYLQMQDWYQNGLPERHIVTVSLARDDGAGNPVAGTIQTTPITFENYDGEADGIILDYFTFTGDLANHTPSVDHTVANEEFPWHDLYWDAELYTYGWFASSAASYGGEAGTPDALYAIDLEVTDFTFVGEAETDYYDGTCVPWGIAGRIQDHNNYWRLELQDINTTNGVVNLVKVLGGTPIIVSSISLAGYGPFPWWGDMILRLTFIGNEITGAVDFSYVDGQHQDPIEVIYRPLELTYTDSAFNTETRAGIWAGGDNVNFDRVKAARAPLGFDALALFGNSSTPDVYTCTDDGWASLIIDFSWRNVRPTPPYNHYWEVYKSVSPYDLFNADCIDWKCVPVDNGAFIVKFEPVSGDTDHILWRFVDRSDPDWGFSSDPGNWRPLEDTYYVVEADGVNVSATFDITVALGNGEGDDAPGTYSQTPPHWDPPIPYAPAPNTPQYTRRFTFIVNGSAWLP